MSVVVVYECSRGCGCQVSGEAETKREAEVIARDLLESGGWVPDGQPDGLPDWLWPFNLCPCCRHLQEDAASRSIVRALTTDFTDHSSPDRCRCAECAEGQLTPLSPRTRTSAAGDAAEVTKPPVTSQL